MKHCNMTMKGGMVLLRRWFGYRIVIGRQRPFTAEW
jgi:hypothetical protein